VLSPASQPLPAIDCHGCRQEASLPFDFTIAFQPIVDLAKGEVFAHEALVRGTEQQSAASVLGQVNDENKYAFDRECRVRAIEMTAALSPPGKPSRVSINFIPGAIYEPKNCIRRTLEAAERVRMPLANIIFEVTENERVSNRQHLINIFREYRRSGLRTAIDDFGAGHAGLTLLAAFQPDLLKLDMELIRDIDQRAASRRIVRAVAEVCRDLGIAVIAEGIETLAECSVLLDLGIELFQGFLFAKPSFKSFATPTLPVLNPGESARRRRLGVTSVTHGTVAEAPRQQPAAQFGQSSSPFQTKRPT
jgi:EAL domain-containing protein (putative c-di-GMP-specific phosphodiesterase class I)